MPLRLPFALDLAALLQLSESRHSGLNATSAARPTSLLQYTFNYQTDGYKYSLNSLSHWHKNTCCMPVKPVAAVETAEWASCYLGARDVKASS